MARCRPVLFLAWAIGPAAASVAGTPAEADPLRGEYGFISAFGGLSQEKARASVRRMASAFGILEFQFYDAFQGYSPPPRHVPDNWTTPLFNRPVSRDIILAYTDEIRKLGGRSWLYVQAMGTDPDDKEAQRGVTVIGKHRVNEKVLLDVVLPTAGWATRTAPAWGRFASSLGFSGIHWDMLGNFKSRMPSGSTVAEFLRASGAELRSRGLAQTCNFVDGFGWDPSLISGTGWSSNVIAFPYWEAWTLPEVEDRFFEEAAPRGGGVLSCFPGKDPDHKDEVQNANAEGIWPLDLLISRWSKARCHGSAYLAIGDGDHHVQDEYLPNRASINEADVDKLQLRVFDDPCGQHDADGAAPSAGRDGGVSGPSRGLPMDPLRGEYGFLTEFDGLTETEARARARGMKDSFGILEFQLFDAFEGYSNPPDADEDEWVNVVFERKIKRSLVLAYTDEIRSFGGRSWLYVQAMGVDPDDHSSRDGFDVSGAHLLGERKLLDVVKLSAAWAEKIAPRWAAFAASLGFSGVHWDTMPAPSSMESGEAADSTDLEAFLREAAVHLRQRGLAQTCAFSTGDGWDSSFSSGGVGWSGNLVAFPFWVARDVPEDEDAFFGLVAPSGGGVYACYPGKDADHKGESQNEGEVGTWPLDLLVRRWRKARCSGSAYVAIGDGLRHVETEYLADAAPMTFEDSKKIHDTVFGARSCAVEGDGAGHEANGVSPVSVQRAGSDARGTASDTSDRSLRRMGPDGLSDQRTARVRWLAFVFLVGVSLVSVATLVIRALMPAPNSNAGALDAQAAHEPSHSRLLSGRGPP